MAKFAKLFEIGKEQVLVRIGYNDEDDTSEVILSTDFDGFCVDLKHGFKDEKTAEKMFNDYTEDDAKRFRKRMKDQLT